MHLQTASIDKEERDQVLGELKNAENQLAQGSTTNQRTMVNLPDVTPSNFPVIEAVTPSVQVEVQMHN